MTSFTFRLYLRNGEQIGTFTTIRPDWLIGDEFRGNGDVRYRIVGMVPREHLGDNADVTGLWTVKPVPPREPD